MDSNAKYDPAIPRRDLANPAVVVRRRRKRYAGRHPRAFEEKYKEHAPDRFSETIRKVLDSGKTPAGSHRPIMVPELLSILTPRPGELAVDCTLGYGGHARELLPRLVPGGRLVGIDQDPVELPKTEARLRAQGFGPEVFTAYRTNFGGLSRILAQQGNGRADIILADLGVSSMQLDNPKRGFSLKNNGPLDMRMNPGHGQSASAFLQNIRAEKLSEVLATNADEPFAAQLGSALAGKEFQTTQELVGHIRTVLSKLGGLEIDSSIRRTFQALRIAVNDEFSALEALLRQMPASLNPGGRVAILSFHSGEDRRVKKAFVQGLREKVYSSIAKDVVRPSSAECRANPRAGAAKLRWAIASK